jgi:hypothetical protein
MTTEPKARGIAAWQWAAALFAAGLVAGCSASPVGQSAYLQGHYEQNALVTNPGGGGPQVQQWGPPANWNPEHP